MRASHKDRQEGIETRGEQEVIAALELSKTQARVAKDLHEFQVKLARKFTEKMVSKLIDRYTDEDELLVQGLEFMKDKRFDKSSHMSAIILCLILFI